MTFLVLLKIRFPREGPEADIASVEEVQMLTLEMFLENTKTLQGFVALPTLNLKPKTLMNQKG